VKSFTLIELIFVLILIAFLSTIAVSYIPDNTLVDNTEALKNLINEKKSFALGYEANMSDSNDKKRVCITFTKTALNSEENSSKIKYFFKVDNITSNYNTICFDKFGRVFHDGIDPQDVNLLHQNVTIMLQYKGKSKTIVVHKITGLVE